MHNIIIYLQKLKYIAMKKPIRNKIVQVLLVLFTLFTSCVSSQSFLPIKGSGMPVDKNISVSGFNGIDVSGGFDVILVQGNSEELILTVQENLFEYITAKVDQGILKIYTENNLQPTKPMKARISFKNLRDLKVSGGGDIICETDINVPELSVNVSGGGDIATVLNTEKLNCDISGGGDVKIDGNVKNYGLKMSGGGNIRSEINAGMIDCEISGGGDITITNRDKASVANLSVSGGGDITLDTKADKVKCSITGGGDANVSGQASNFEVSMNGGGDIKASQLLTDYTIFHVSGGSDVHVNATKELSGNISGGGDVYYSGSPDKVSIDARGGSEIHKE